MKATTVSYRHGRAKQLRIALSEEEIDALGIKIAKSAGSLGKIAVRLKNGRLLLSRNVGKTSPVGREYTLRGTGGGVYYTRISNTVLGYDHSDDFSCAEPKTKITHGTLSFSLADLS